MTQEERDRAARADTELSKYRGAMLEIAACQRQITRLRALSVSIGAPAPDAAPVAHSGHSDRVADAAIAIADAEGELALRVSSAMALRRKIMHEIGTVADEHDRRMMEMRYIECASWWQIACELGYSDASNARRRGLRVLAGMGIGNE